MCKIYKLLMIISFFFVVGCQNIDKKSVSKESNNIVSLETEYLQNVENFNKITVEEFDNIDKTNIFLYLGRPSCPFCREFVKNLKVLHNTTGIKLYYIDTTDFSNNQKLKDMVSKYDLKGVPSLIYFENITTLQMYNRSVDLSDWIINKISH